jgi:hypothetical protein
MIYRWAETRDLEDSKASETTVGNHFCLYARKEESE